MDSKEGNVADLPSQAPRGLLRPVVGLGLVLFGLLCVAVEIASSVGMTILGALLAAFGFVVLDVGGIRRFVPGFRGGGRTRHFFALCGYLFAAFILAGIFTGYRSSGDSASVAADARPTRTAVLPTATPSKADAETIDPRRMVAAPKDYKGKRVVITGEANNVDHYDTYTWIQFLAQVPDRNLTESVVVEIRPRDTAIVKSDCYRIYGTVAGTQTVKTVLTGATHESLQIDAYAWETYPPTKYGSCAPSSP